MNSFQSDDCNPSEEILSWIKGSLTSENAVIFVSESDNKINGFARVQSKKRSSDQGEIINYAKLNDLYVVKELRRKGIASRLINASIEWAKNNQLPDIILNVYKNNNTAHSLYETFGFKDDCIISDNRVRMKYHLYG